MSFIKLYHLLFTFGWIGAVRVSEQQLPLGWQDPLTTCPKWEEITTYESFYELPNTPTLGSSPLLLEQFYLKFNQSVEIIMFAEDHTNPRMINIIEHNLPTLSFNGYKVFADELPPHIQLQDLGSISHHYRANFYKQLEYQNINIHGVDDSYHHEVALKAYTKQVLVEHTLQNTFEQRDQVMALRFLYLALYGNGKLFSLNGYLHLGIARHLLAYGCRVIFISENTEIVRTHPYDKYIIQERNLLLGLLLKKYSNFIYAELPIESTLTVQEEKVTDQINRLITIKPFQVSVTSFKAGFFSSEGSVDLSHEHHPRKLINV